MLTWLRCFMTLRNCSSIVVATTLNVPWYRNFYKCVILFHRVGCAPEDCPLLVFKAFDRVADSVFGSRVACRSSFSAEIDGKKQNFLCLLFAREIQVLFRYVCDLGKGLPACY